MGQEIGSLSIRKDSPGYRESSEMDWDEGLFRNSINEVLVDPRIAPQAIKDDWHFPVHHRQSRLSISTPTKPKQPPVYSMEYEGYRYSQVAGSVSPCHLKMDQGMFRMLSEDNNGNFVERQSILLSDSRLSTPSHQFRNSPFYDRSLFLEQTDFANWISMVNDNNLVDICILGVAEDTQPSKPNSNDQKIHEITTPTRPKTKKLLSVSSSRPQVNISAKAVKSQGRGVASPVAAQLAASYESDHSSPATKDSLSPKVFQPKPRSAYPAIQALLRESRLEQEKEQRRANKSRSPGRVPRYSDGRVVKKGTEFSDSESDNDDEDGKDTSPIRTIISRLETPARPIFHRHSFSHSTQITAITNLSGVRVNPASRRSSLQPYNPADHSKSFSYSTRNSSSAASSAARSNPSTATGANPTESASTNSRYQRPHHRLMPRRTLRRGRSASSIHPRRSSTAQKQNHHTPSLNRGHSLPGHADNGRRPVLQRRNTVGETSTSPRRKARPNLQVFKDQAKLRRRSSRFEQKKLDSARKEENLEKYNGVLESKESEEDGEDESSEIFIKKFNESLFKTREEIELEMSPKSDKFRKKPSHRDLRRSTTEVPSKDLNRNSFPSPSRTHQETEQEWKNFKKAKGSQTSKRLSLDDRDILKASKSKKTTQSRRQSWFPMRFSPKEPPKPKSMKHSNSRIRSVGHSGSTNDLNDDQTLIPTVPGAPTKNSEYSMTQIEVVSVATAGTSLTNLPMSQVEHAKSNLVDSGTFSAIGGEEL
ncbi:hypothetical protein AAMO2058_000982700 [Amorphochlora amoebiformis]